MTRARHAATLFAAVAHLAYALADRLTDPLARHLLHDAARYDTWAKAIVAGRVFEPGAFSQAPLYPYLLAALYAIAGPHPALMIAVQVILGVATVALVGSAAARAFGEEPGVWAAWLTAGYGVCAFFETKLVPVSMVVCLAALFIVIAQRADTSVRRIVWLGGGAVLGLLVIGNAASMVLLAATLAWILLDASRPSRERALRALLCLAGAAIFIAPVAARNYTASGDLTLVTDNAGVTFWHGNNPRSVGVYSTPEGFSGAIATQREESIALATAEVGRPLDGKEVSRHWLGKGVRFLVSHPGRAAWLMARKGLLAITSNEQPLEYSPRLDPSPLRWLLPIPFAAIFALAVLAVPATFRERAGQPALLTVASTLLTLLVFYVASRYRLPAMPGMAILAGLGGKILRERLVQPGRGAVPITAGITAVAVSSFWFPLTQAVLSKTQNAMTLSDFATAQRETGRLDAAVQSYRASITLDPDAPYSHLDLAKALAYAGRDGEAVSETKTAIRLDPSIGEAHFDLGVLQFRSGNFDAAASAFREAYRLEPDNALAGNNLAGTCLKLGRTDEARTTVMEMRARGLEVDPPLLRAIRP